MERKHDILYNPLKSKCMIIKPNRYKLKIPDVYINDVKLDYVQQIKYLGVILTNTFKDDMDIARQLRSLYASSNIILRKICIMFLYLLKFNYWNHIV